MTQTQAPWLAKVKRCHCATTTVLIMMLPNVKIITKCKKISSILDNSKALELTKGFET